jgi:hypothetical protein
MIRSGVWLFCPRFDRAEPNVTVPTRAPIVSDRILSNPEQAAHSLRAWAESNADLTRLLAAACLAYTHSSQAEVLGHSAAVRGAVPSVYAIKIATPTLGMRGHEGD